MASLSDLTDADFEAIERGDLAALSDTGFDIYESVMTQQSQADLNTNINAQVQDAIDTPYASGSAPVVVNPGPEMDLKRLNAGMQSNFAAQGFSDAFKRQGIGLGQTLNEMLGVVGLDTDKLPRASDTREFNESVQKYALTPSMYPGYKTGDTVGTIASAAPLALATRNPAVFGAGAAYGFAQPTEQENDLKTRGLNSLLYGTTALGGNMLGQGITAAGRGLLNPALPSKAVADLTNRGVPLTPGQFRGGLPKTVEDAATSVPFLGPKITDARMQSIEGFNRATLNNALEPIDSTVTKIGFEGFDQANTAISNVYDDAYKALPTVKIEGDSGKQLADEFFNIQGSIIKDGSRKDYKNQMTKEFYNQFNLNKASGIPGRAWGDVQKTLRDRGFKILKTDEELGQALIDTSAAMNEMAARTSGKFGELLKSANLAHRNMRGVRNATASAATNEGVFMPSQLLSGIKKSDKSPDKLSFAKGNMPLQDFGRSGQSVLPSKMPNSGTADRQALMQVVGGGSAALGGAGFGLPGAIGVPGALMASRSLYRPGSMAAINRMRNRPDLVRAAGSGFNIPQVLRAPVTTGLFGANTR